MTMAPLYRLHIAIMSNNIRVYIKLIPVVCLLKKKNLTKNVENLIMSGNQDEEEQKKRR